jgi:5-methylcytosine-specific restriction enzyme subunit McrC
MVDVPLDQLLTADGELDLDSTAAGRYFTLQFAKKKLRLQARGHIGFIPINERVAVDVLPRCDIANLSRVLRTGGFAPQVIETSGRSYVVDPDELPNLRDFYAEVLLEELAQIEAFGQMREYERRVERTTSPRGRLVLGAPETQLAAAGWSASVVAAWFERTADIPANRCLKLSIWLLAQAYARSDQPTRGQRRLVRGLNRFYGLFADAALDHRLDFLRDPIVRGTMPLPSTRAYYRNALDVASLIVRSSSIAFDRAGSDVHMPSVAIEMDKVFERYIRAVLDTGLAPFRPSLSVLDGNTQGAKPLFDAPPSEDATPDIVFELADESTPVVLDVKYKPAKSGPDRTDLNQVIAYGASYRSEAVVVVQPRADNSPRHGLVHLGDIEALSAYQYVVDLDAELEVEEREMVAALGELAGAEQSDEGVTSSEGENGEQIALSLSV